MWGVLHWFDVVEWRNQAKHRWQLASFPLPSQGNAKPPGLALQAPHVLAAPL